MMKWSGHLLSPCRLLALGAILSLLLSVAARGAERQTALDFNKDIEPILADHCYQCHGPDPGGRKANLRLDRPESAFAKLKDGRTPIVKEEADHSEMIRRVSSTDPDEHMPPAPHEALSARQIEVLRQWIEQGAHYRDHWSFEKPIRPALPDVKRKQWLRNPIDRFILSELEARGLTPSPEASRRELIRRVTLDLTGLLPAPAEVDAFVNDPSSDAYEKVVDRLLASPRFGEHRTHYWLDYVRYGDTHGLHNDNYRDIWPYRDYVIRAFNANKPFDQFAMEQIAGDLLPPTDVDQIVATGFIRCNLSTGEGGTINEEIRVNNNRDRAEAFGTVFMGLTVGCAVCHDHKFDPITQKDFYQLTAYFNNLAERASNDDRADVPPTIRVPRPEHRKAYNEVLAEKAGIERLMNARRDDADALVKQWLASADGPRRVSEDGLALRFRFDEGTGDAAVNSAPGAEPKTYPFTGSKPVWGEQTWLWPSLRFEANTKLSIPAAGDFEKDQPFSAGGWIQVRFNPTGIGDVPAGCILSRLDSAHAARGWDMYYDNGALTVHLVNTWPSNAIKVQTTTKVPRGEWHHVFFTYDGSGKGAGVKIFADGKPQPVKVLNDTLTETIRTTVPWELGRRHDSDVLKLARFQDIRLYSRALSFNEVARLPYEDYAAEIATRPMKDWTEDQHHVVSEYFLDSVDEPMSEFAARVDTLDRRLDELSQGGDVAMVCRERPQVAYADVLARGVYTHRVERVRPDIPHFLPRAPKDAPRNRLGLARWVVSPDNPLTARVTVNRMWQELFGVGIVETTGDFGMMGARPSHPELLDWLAVEFQRPSSSDAHPWDIKHIYRLMVTSAAYRQSSRITPEFLEKDPQNRLVARGPRFRMDAEMLRDCALEVSGLLVEKIGGASVKPYQPPGIWEAVRGLATRPRDWVRDKGEGTYRRSLYTFWKRQAPVPDMIALDAPPRDISCPRRERTNTPLQALVLWNDPQWLEASRMLAQRAMKEGGASPEDRLDFLAQLVLCRPLDSDEKRIFLDSLAAFNDRYADDPKSAAKLLSVGDAKCDSALSKPELAAWTLVASQILNTDEALNK